MNASRQLTELIEDLVAEHATEAVQALWDSVSKATPEVDGALRLSKAAEAIDVSTSTMRRLVADDEIETIEVAGIAHVRISELNRWLDDCTARARRAKVAADARAARRRRGKASA